MYVRMSTGGEAPDGKVTKVGSGCSDSVRGYCAQLTPLRFAKWLFQMIVFLEVLYLTLLVMYATSLDTAWRLAGLGALPAVLFALIPLGRVLPLYTLLTATDYSPSADRPAAPLADGPAMDLPTPRTPAGALGSGLRGLPPLSYTPMLQSPYEPPSPSVAPASSGAPVLRRGLAPLPPAGRGGPTQDFYGVRGRSDSYTSY
jgi:hypothetical protein